MSGFNPGSGDPICFNFNRQCGCTGAPAGGRCGRGMHICIKCGGDHSYSLPCPNL